MVKKIAILGSTGSIGRQTLQVIDQLGPGYQVVALTAGKNARLLADQVEKYRPEIAALSDQEAIGLFKKLPAAGLCSLLEGAAGQISAFIESGADLIVLSQVGFSGFEPLLAALKAKRLVALANKEAIVTGGEILNRMGLLDHNLILPLDSEHSAIWQCLDGAEAETIEKIILTASGGPFFGRSAEELNNVSPKDALKHPNWQMGPKITIDSATMMNKGLEVIEAHWLFKLPYEKIEVAIHPQSLVHSMVEYVDGSVLAQLSEPDMRLAIQYALTYPKRVKTKLPRLKLFNQMMQFFEPDRKLFPALDLAIRAGQAGGTMPAVLSGANEIAVRAFMEQKIAFTAITEVVEQVLQQHDRIVNPDVEDILAADAESRLLTENIVAHLTGVK